MKKMNKKGFTLAELLIVVAIIAVLVAIAIPVFTAQLEKSREATDIANVRSAYATVVADYLTNNKAASATVDATQTKADWQGQSGNITVMVNGVESTLNYAAKTTGNKYSINMDSNGSLTIN